MIPISNTKVCEILNINVKVGEKPLFTEHEQQCLNLLERYMTEDDYNDSLTAAETTPLHKLTAIAYANIMLYLNYEALNTNTVGSGIVVKAGSLDNVTELLSPSQIQINKKQALAKALDSIYDYLNDAGLSVLNSISKKQVGYKVWIT